MNEYYTVGGHSIAEKGRALRTHPAGRRCKRDGCPTILSKYNSGDLCYLHSPIKRPRLRGRMPSEVMEDKPKLSKCRGCVQRNRRWKSRNGGGDFAEVIIDDVIHREGTRGRATLCEEP